MSDSNTAQAYTPETVLEQAKETRNQQRLPEFKPWPKIPRHNKPLIITEKIDGTNGIVHVDEQGTVIAGSRTRWLVDGAENFGFAAWVKEHEGELRMLGPGYHYGEWYGQGIQRGYGLSEKRFALFNVHRWHAKSLNFPPCCEVVPIIHTGVITEALAVLRLQGSQAVPGYMNPEGVVVYHTGSGTLHKVLLENDDKPKGTVAA